jgi:predicted Zn-dependent protease with MMP-like domain/Flp pilus assembly protein TadD
VKAATGLERGLERGWDQLEAGDLAKATRTAEELHRRSPDAPEVLILLAACDRAQDRPTQALQRLDSAIRLGPQWAEPELHAAELLADQGQLDRALAYARRGWHKAEDGITRTSAIALVAGLELDLDRTADARIVLDALPPPIEAETIPEVAIEIAFLLMTLEDPEGARGWFERAVALDEEDADAWHGIGLSAELLGDEEGKRRAWLRTLDLDKKQERHLPDLLSEKQTADIAEAALAELPPHARRLLVNVPILITDRPARADVAGGLDPRLLGLFSGTAYPEVSSLGPSPQLTQILLFRRNLERVADDEEELRNEIRTTLLHETGHFFGLSEDDLHGLGLG